MTLYERGEHIRSLSAIRDGERWSWHERGDPLPFEQTERYAERRIQHRFTPDMLDDYLQAWAGLRVFDLHSYGKAAILTDWARAPWKQYPGRVREETLEEAQRRL